MSDFPTAVGPKMTTRGYFLLGFRVAIPDLLRQDLLEGGGDDLAAVRLQLVIPREVDLNAALHRRAGHFVHIALETFKKI
jgi:hypothetical protein